MIYQASMNILRKITKEVLLVPVRVVEGIGDAIDHVVDPKPSPPTKDK